MAVMGVVSAGQRTPRKVVRRRIRLGTSGYAYTAWRRSFYPEGLPASRFLEHYRLPPARTFAGWASGVPAGFTFTVKAPQQITHRRRLRDASRDVGRFWKATAELGKARGPLLFGLPPNFRKDVPLLGEFLRALPAGCRAAFEFRHASWFDDEVFDLLRRRKVCLCVADAEALSTPLVATTPWGYVRLRRDDYSERELRAWAKRLAAQPWKEAFVYLKHDDAGRGPALALRLVELLGAKPRRTKSP
jgi:uncharacterized protein YecE (DUF72 family)